MPDLHSVIAELYASKRALEAAEEQARTIELGEEDLASIREARAHLTAMLDKLHDEATKLQRNIKVSHALRLISKSTQD
jgi:predicted nuclease with TOPRIM domain